MNYRPPPIGAAGKTPCREGRTFANRDGPGQSPDRPNSAAVGVRAAAFGQDEAMALDKERMKVIAREAAQFVPDVARLFRDVAKDPRVPKRVKYEVAAAAAYLVLPIDVIPDFIPGLGQLDDVAVIGWAVRRLLLGAGENVLREHWHGTDRGMEILLQAAAAGLRPRKLLAALAFGAATFAKRPDDEDVIDGEVLSET
jgi:uncharacterized membrane protein YkvA (DUF1232 family)